MISTNPNDLNLVDRFDIYIKIYFLKSLFGNLDRRKGNAAYMASIYAMNSFVEYDENYKPVKSSFDDFKISFIKLNKSILKNGFDVNSGSIPISEKKMPLNGAHRIASALFNREDVVVTESKCDVYCKGWSYKFFMDHLYPLNFMESVFLNTIDYRKNIYCACLYPSSELHHQDIIELISNESDIVIDFCRSYNETGRKILTSIFYENESWVGKRENQYKGTKNKYKNCFVNNKDTVKYVVFKFKDNSDDLKRVLMLKESIRSICNMGKHSVHITDNKNETRSILTSVMSPASHYWINNQRISKFNKFEKFLDNIDLELERHNIEKSSFVLTGSSVMSVFGLRDCNDIDAISLQCSDEELSLLNIGSHNKYFEDFDFDIKSIISDEDNIFYYRGYRFLSIEWIKRFKRKRSEEKDMLDLKLIDTLKIVKNKKFKYYISIVVFYCFNFSFKKSIKKTLILLNLLR
ncbi:hypothetical protein BCU26_024440 [Vibrio splendidus]|uniref:hypothetical protein n=1 Tax=Vibrio splendidus TaxID=29497 RepID=UPI000C827BCE|nr:hypothetical protein [Vibrio splendidus]PMJ32655.1 hypothetical protein BCU26_09635 [Vibrio splendidus]